MASELDAFAKVALYLKDPLVLSGFVIFVGFLALRQLLKSGIIPVLQQGQGFKILRLLLSYGFVLGLAIILLGMGLKYRELSEGEQRRAAGLISNELETNVTVVSELGKNTDSLSQLGQGLAGILRDRRFKILAGLFPVQNIETTVDESTLTNLYIERLDWLAQSRLWEDITERRRTEEACAAISRFVDRTKSTVESLSDQQAVRYQITRRAYDANLDIVRKISVVDMTKLANLYYRMSDVRVLYNRIVAGSLEYMTAIRAFCGSLPPSSGSLSSALALERLTFRLLPEYRQKIDDTVKAILEQILALDGAGLKGPTGP
ncbi:MAG TPA: hypothetical protein VIY51_28145 [Xanthobacteraceae bacterium]